MVAAGGFWFLPATQINAMAQAGTVSKTTAFVGYLAGVCAIAAGLTFLETVANPYTTVLGPQRYAATRINLAQSCNGVGWILGPIIGGVFFYSMDAAGQEHRQRDALHSLRHRRVRRPRARGHLLLCLHPRHQDRGRLPPRRCHAQRVALDLDASALRAGGRRPVSLLAAQAGIFSFFINYMTEEVPPIPASWRSGHAAELVRRPTRAAFCASATKGRQSLDARFRLLPDRPVHRRRLLKKFSAHKILGLYGVMNVVACLLVFAKLGWLSVACVFLSFFFMSIMFPTIFALGIFGLGARAKKASAFIVMAIMGGAVLPKLMGHVADQYDMSRGFIVPMACFAFVAFYGFCWPKFSKAESLHGVGTSGGH